MIFQCLLYLCNRFLIGAIRDLYTFSELLKTALDRGRTGV